MGGRCGLGAGVHAVHEDPGPEAVTKPAAVVHGRASTSAEAAHCGDEAVTGRAAEVAREEAEWLGARDTVRPCLPSCFSPCRSAGLSKRALQVERCVAGLRDKAT